MLLNKYGTNECLMKRKLWHYYGSRRRGIILWGSVNCPEIIYMFDQKLRARKCKKAMKTKRGGAVAYNIGENKL